MLVLHWYWWLLCSDNGYQKRSLANKKCWCWCCIFALIFNLNMFSYIFLQSSLYYFFFNLPFIFSIILYTSYFFNLPFIISSSCMIFLYLYSLFLSAYFCFLNFFLFIYYFIFCCLFISKILWSLLYFFLINFLSLSYFFPISYFFFIYCLFLLYFLFIS